MCVVVLCVVIVKIIDRGNSPLYNSEYSKYRLTSPVMCRLTGVSKYKEVRSESTFQDMR